MEKLKQLSVRIDSDTIRKIDEMANETTYWKRNTIINQILTVMMQYTSKDGLFNIMQFHPNAFHCVEITVKLIK